MDPDYERRQLRKAEKDIAEAWHRIEEQRRRIAQLASDGHDTTTGESLLATMIESAHAMEAHRQIILRELDQ
jgi:multidrug resistance efflux pump